MVNRTGTHTMTATEYLVTFDAQEFHYAARNSDGHLYASLDQIGGHALIEDLIQEAYVYALEHCAAYKPEKGEPAVWLFYLFKYFYALPYFKKYSVLKTNETHYLHEVKEQHIMQEGQELEPDPYQEVIATLLRHCTDLQRDAIEQTLFRGVSQRAYAEQLGIKRTALRNRIQQGIIRVRKVLAENPTLAQELQQRGTRSIFCRMSIEKCPGSGKWQHV